ncbi:MAG: hypothetical protein HZA90_02675 [Verrucomicrobia bacterium]|nr:hypothetical protein [Verrucomicrobiota bacterium]
MYRVLVLPDFWFDMEGVRLDGGPQQCGEDFIPFYFGNPGRDEFSRVFGLHVDLVIDAGRITEDETIGLQDAVTEGIERVNFGTVKNPRWLYTAGFWLRHNRLGNGLHTLQLRTSLHLNNVVGAGEQFLTLSNSPVRVWTTNSIMFPNWNSEVGGNWRFQAKSAEPRVNWRIDIRDHKGKLLASKTGTTTNGEIGWTWDLRDRKGKVHDTLEDDPYFQPSVTIWPLGETPKGSQLLTRFPKARDSNSWWWQRLGSKYVRKPPTPDEVPMSAEENRPINRVAPRPLELP